MTFASRSGAAAAVLASLSDGQSAKASPGQDAESSADTESVMFVDKEKLKGMNKYDKAIKTTPILAILSEAPGVDMSNLKRQLTAAERPSTGDASAAENIFKHFIWHLSLCCSRSL